jgi:dihydrolipoamide dehydrogenase
MLDIRVPDIGDFTDVPIIEILVNPGDEVAVEDPLVTLESDKATMDVPAPAAGRVEQLRVKVGDRVSEGSVLLTLEAEGYEATPGAAPAPAAAGSRAPEGASEASSPQTGSPAPQTGTVTREPAPPAAPSERDAQVVVLGSGPGGYAAAFRAADLGLKTVLVERHQRLGGVCLNVGCIPSKALLHAARVISETADMAEHGIAFQAPKIDLPALMAWKDSVVERLTGGLAGLARQRKVEVVTGEAQISSPTTLTVGGRQISFENLIIAAGSESVRLPFLPEDPRVIDSTGALSPTEVPRRLLVIGGGIIGLEMATVYHALGSRVTVVEMMDQLIPGADPDLVKLLHQRIESRYHQILLKTQVTAVKAQKNGLKVEFSDGKPQTYDRILVAVGRRPNGHGIGAENAGLKPDDTGFIRVDHKLRTGVPGIYAIGDIVGGPMLAHKATHEGKLAAEHIAGHPGAEFDPRAIPSVAYTDPEVAWMGLTEADARSQGIDYEKTVFPWGASGRALGLGRPDGLTKLLFEPGTNRLLGAGIVGINAGDLIAETVHAIEMGANAEDLAQTIHPHPTLSETIGFAAELQDGSITDLMPARRRR